MNIRSTYKIISSSAEETKSLGKKIGQRLKGGEVFMLSGDLGAGKTVLVRGIVEGMGIKEEVSSPSFTITNVYKGNKLVVHHMDFYRIHDAGVLRHELKETISDKSNIVIIEWPNIIQQEIVDNTIIVNFMSTDEESRNIEFSYLNNLDYVFNGIKK